MCGRSKFLFPFENDDVLLLTIIRIRLGFGAKIAGVHKREFDRGWCEGSENGQKARSRKD